MEASTPFEHPIYLEGAKVILRPPHPSDLSRIYRWINNPAIQRNIMVFRPMHWDEQKIWLDKLLAGNNTNIVFAIEEKESRTHIGHMGLHDIDYRNGLATSGSLIGETNKHKQGLGTDAKMLLLRYAFHTLGLRKVCSAAKAFNTASIRHNQKCGFQIVGTRKQQWFIDGGLVDEVILEVFRSEWERKWAAYQKGEPLL